MYSKNYITKIHNKLSKLIRIAHKVREQFEQEYEKEETFQGFCGLVSYRIILMANYNKIYPTLVHGYYKAEQTDSISWPHAWIEYEDSIIDATATQFDIKDRVHVVSSFDKRYTPIQIGKNINDILEIIHWCKDQIEDDIQEKVKVVI